MSESESYYSTGRGGAGNVKVGKAPEVREGKMGQEYPHLTSEYYSTGRGGAGNMKKNEPNSNQARKAQDVDEDSYSSIAPSSSNRSVTGRGGYGNVHRVNSNDSNSKAAASANNNNNKSEPSLLKRAMNFFKS